MYKVKINLLSTKTPALGNPDRYLLPQFHYCQVFVDVCVIIRFNIPQIQILKPKTHKLSTPQIMASSEKNLGNIQFI